jgi:hypothetical protein
MGKVMQVETQFIVRPNAELNRQKLAPNRTGQELSSKKSKLMKIHNAGATTLEQLKG